MRKNCLTNLRAIKRALAGPVAMGTPPGHFLAARGIAEFRFRDNHYVSRALSVAKPSLATGAKRKLVRIRLHLLNRARKCQST